MIATSKKTPAALNKEKVNAVTRIVADHYGLTPKGLMADGREEPRVTYRQVAMFLARELTGATYEDLAVAFGKKDHQTIVHAERTIPNKASQNQSLRETLALLRKTCAAAIETKAT